MKIIKDIEQGTEAWLEWRRSRITATDAGVILGLNPWTNPIELWKQKLQMVPPIQVNDRMNRGRELEPIARQEFIHLMGIDMVPLVVESDEYFWCGASLDGFNEEINTILEIKCPSLASHRAAIDGVIAEYYMSQVQHQLFCTGAEKCYYWSYHPDVSQKCAVIEITPNLEYIKNMVEKEKYFYEVNMCQMIEPEKPWKLGEKCKNVVSGLI